MSGKGLGAKIHVCNRGQQAEKEELVDDIWLELEPVGVGRRGMEDRAENTKQRPAVEKNVNPGPNETAEGRG